VKSGVFELPHGILGSFLFATCGVREGIARQADARSRISSVPLVRFELIMANFSRKVDLDHALKMRVAHRGGDEAPPAFSGLTKRLGEKLRL
jgi:hypothetical protein